MELVWLQGTEFERLPAFAASLAIGLLIGLERARHSCAKSALRTFSLNRALKAGGDGCSCAAPGR